MCPMEAREVALSRATASQGSVPVLQRMMGETQEAPLRTLSRETLVQASRGKELIH